MGRFCYDFLMKILMTLILVGVVGLISLVVASYFSPQVFLKTTYTLVKREFPSLPEFSNQSLHRLSVDERADYVLVDVRTPQEQAVSMLPGAIDQADFERDMPAYHDKKVIVYCTIGYRSGYYTQELLQQGLDAYNLSEGILGWANVDGLLLDPQGRKTSQVHVYSRPWNWALKNHVAVF